MPSTQINVEEALARVVKGAGGDLVSNLLTDRAKLPDNADYVFPEDNVIAELKRLERDHNESEIFRQKLTHLYQKLMLQGKVPVIYGTRQIELRNLPEESALKFVSLYREPIRQRISKANKQIKSTKRLLKMPDAFGLLILVHDGDYSITPESVLNLSSRCLNGNIFSSIHNLIYLSGNMVVTRPGDPMGYRVFLPAFRDANRSIAKDLIDKLNVGWRNELAKISEMPMNTDVYPPKEFIDTLRYQKPRR
jgi:hypothetical protein